MRHIIFGILMIISTGCNTVKERLVHNSFNIERIGSDLLAQYTKQDTIIQYYQLSSGGIIGSEEKLFILKKKKQSTQLKYYTSYYEFEETTIEFDWQFVLNNLIEIKNEKLKRDAQLHIMPNGDSVQTYGFGSHGAFTRVEIFINGSEVKYGYMNMEYIKKLNPYKLQLVEQLKVSTTDIPVTVKSYKLKPKNYNFDKIRWQRWDKRHKAK